MPTATNTQYTADVIQLPKPKAKYRRETQTDATVASAATANKYGLLKRLYTRRREREPDREVNEDYDYNDDFLEEDAKAFGRENLGPVARP